MTKRREFYKSSYKKVQNPGNINYLSYGKITLAHKIDREFIKKLTWAYGQHLKLQ